MPNANKTNEEVNRLSGRILSLVDEIAVLKAEFNQFKNMVAADMKKVVTQVQKNARK
tara:strand:- start:35 stop:205 length:171 start_codon:yes stop_codon:yes gene_type:complete